MRIGIVAGEASGDTLAANLIQTLKQHYQNLIIEGVAGPKMITAGCTAIFPLEKLAVMGIIEPIKHLPEIIKIRRYLQKYFLNNPPDVFIGIDAPDFNLGLEIKLKQAGIPVVHYVSPTVWAWRKGRIHKIKRAVNLMLTLFPFETTIYQEHNIPVKFVGHPLADKIPLHPDKQTARAKLNLPHDAKILAILPGSRKMELKHLAKQFIQAAKICLSAKPNLKIITAMVNSQRRQQFSKILAKTMPDLPITIFDQQAQTVLAAADVALLTSGTITLEAMLLKTPMVVAYRMSKINLIVAALLIRIKYFSIPNLIANKKIVPEFLQMQATAKNLAAAILEQLNDRDTTKATLAEFTRLHQLLRKNASQQAANAIIQLLGSS
jgi:lipid-A-disaccharide synthase